MSLCYLYDHLFFILGALLSIWEGFFFAEMASGFQPLAIFKKKLHLRCLTVFWLYFLIQCNVDLLSVLLFILIYLFCYFIITFFYHTRFNIFSDVGFLCCSLWAIFLYFISFLSHSFIRRYLLQRQLIHIYYSMFYVQLLTLNDSMPFYCFNHCFNDKFMVTLFKQ